METLRPRPSTDPSAREMHMTAEMNLADLLQACESYKTDSEPETELKLVQEESQVMEPVMEVREKPDTAIQDDGRVFTMGHDGQLHLAEDAS